MSHNYYNINCGTERGDFLSPRTGRPKAENPKTIEVKARIDVETDERLKEYCLNHEVSRTDVVRKGIDLVLESDKK